MIYGVIDLREAIRQQLISQIPIQNRCYEPHAADKHTEKPYLVICQGVDTEENSWSGFRRIVEIWPYTKRTSFKEVDDLTKQVINVLDKELLVSENGEAFTCNYIGTAGQDVVDMEWDILTRGLRFAVMALQPVAINETVMDDPWINALTEWAQNLLGEQWTIYANRWPLGYKRPAILWRLSDYNVEDVSRAIFEIKKTFVCHVLGSTPNEEIKGITDIIQGFSRDIKIPLDLINRKYMTVINPKGEFNSNSLNRGQISVVLSRKTSRPQEDVPIMQKIESSGQFYGGD